MRRSWISTVAFCLVAVVPAAAQAPIEVGAVEPISVKSESLAGSGAWPTRDGWELEISHPGATYIAVHFSRFNLPAGESVTVSDAFGDQSYTLSGRGKRNAGTFWARHVKGDTVVLEFTTRRALATGFEIDRYAAGHVSFGAYPSDSSLDGFDSEAICGEDDKENAVCYADSHPTEYDLGRAVARLLIEGVRLCTGWLASADSHLITNEHCITDDSEALNTDYEFMAEVDKCPHSSCILCDPGTVYSGATFIQDSADLDYALVRIDSGDPAATYGFLEIDDRDAVTGELIYIPQHPGGHAKQIAIESSDPNDAGWCEVDGFTEGCTSTGYLDVGYQCDTKGGSSGSPVLARSSHKVIALHHCADCLNRAVPINLICDEVCPILNAPPCMLSVDDLVLQDDTVLSNEMHEACESITTGGNYAVAPGGELTVRTRDKVILRAGTSVAPSGELRVDLDPLTGAQ